MRTTPPVVAFTNHATGDGRTFQDLQDATHCAACTGCCRHFRVSFYQGELDSQPGGTVPADLAVPVTPFLVCMKGTETGDGRCIALGDDGRCGIYLQRPSPCREFLAYWPDGSTNPLCRELRARSSPGAHAAIAVASPNPPPAPEG